MSSVNMGEPHGGRQTLKEHIHVWSAAAAQRQSATLHSNATGYLLVAGIDRMSLLNEALGSAFIDKVIEKIFIRLRETFSEQVFIARIGGDVFGLFFPNAPHAEMASVAQHLVRSFHVHPVQTEKGPVAVSISIGGVLMRQNNSHDGLTHAEAALRVAKDKGRGRFISYHEAAEEIQTYRRTMETGQTFMKALKEGRLKLAFQPVMNSKTNQVSFHESLIRYIDEHGKMHSAEQFIPAIEKLGLTTIIDRYVMGLAIRELDQYPDLILSFNVSNLTLQDEDWLRGLVAALRHRPKLAGRMIIELTETVAMADMGRAKKVIQTLRDMGCSVALDDFGAGYTAFSQIRELGVNFVKIDKSFIRNLDQKESMLFIRTLQTLAEGLGIQTVGEGAETLNEARQLADDGVNFIQGYVYGFPVTERVWLPKNHEKRQFDHALNEDDFLRYFPQSMESSVFTSGRVH